MDNMIKQMRVKYFGIDIDEGETSDPLESDELRTTVDAAAFAVNSVEERRRRLVRRKDSDFRRKPERKQEDGAVNYVPRRGAMERILSSSASKMKNTENDDTVPISAPTATLFSRESSGELQPQRANSPVNKGPFFRITSVAFDKQSADKRKPENSSRDNIFDQLPTIEVHRKRPEISSNRDSIFDQLPTIEVHRKRPEISSNKDSIYDQLPTIEVHRKQQQQRPEDIKADVWEKTKMERLKERYEKLNAKILEWENEKKEKAKKKLSRKQQDTKKRDGGLQEYKSQMKMIDQIAQGARAQAEENQRKEVIKVKKKAEIIRLTGNIPTKTCLCF